MSSPDSLDALPSSFNLCPVDYVATAITAFATLPPPAPPAPLPVYHLCAPAPLPMTRLIDWLGQHRGCPLASVSLNEFQRRLAALDESRLTRFWIFSKTISMGLLVFNSQLFVFRDMLLDRARWAASQAALASVSSSVEGSVSEQCASNAAWVSLSVSGTAFMNKDIKLKVNVFFSFLKVGMRRPPPWTKFCFRKFWIF